MPHPIAETAREAYAIGWASTGGPLTDRVRAGCVAAVGLAVEHADEPHVLEATLHLGKLEGTWAAAYDRREKLHVRTVTAIVTAWAAFGLAAQAPDLVRAARLHAGLTEAASIDDWFTQIARSVIAQNLNVTGIHGLSDAIQSALIQAQAEGRAAAGALLAQQHDVVGFDFEIAFNDAYKALQGASSLVGAAEVDGWLSKLLGGNADEVGAKLATMTGAGASYEDMVSAISGILDGASSRSIATTVDVLTSRAVSQGALDLYRSDGLTHVDFLTAGSGNVCPVCLALEAKNPYLLADAPRPGIHIFCRCALAPSGAAVATLAAAATALPSLGTAADVTAADVSTADMAIAAAWGTTATDAADATAAGLERHLASGVASSQLLGGGMSAETSLVTFNDGGQAVLKVAKQYAERPPTESTDAEYLTAKLGQELGIRVPEVVRAADNTVYMGYVSDAQTGMERFDTEAADRQAVNALADSVEGRRLGLLDLVTGNTDRNDGNWLIDAAGQLTGIDHGMAFQVYRSPAQLVELVTGRNPFAGRLLEMDYQTHRVAGGTRAFTRADIDHVRAALQRLEGEFASLRRRAWFRQTMARLNWLAKHAGDGEGTLFP